MGLKGLLFLGILIATYLLIFSEVAARELAEAPITKDSRGGGYGGWSGGCTWGCCGHSYHGCGCCSYADQEGRQAKP